MGSLLEAIGAVLFGKKHPKHQDQIKDEPQDIIVILKAAPEKLPEQIFHDMKNSGVKLVPVIIKFWRELSSGKRAQILTFWESQGYMSHFIRALGAKSEDDCIQATEVLMAIKDKKLLHPLLDALEEPGQFVPARVAEVLIAFGPEAVEPMVGRLPHLSESVKCLVISILEELRDAKAVPALLRELSETSSRVRMEAVDALGEIGDPETATSLISMMEDSHWGVRARAAKALGKIGAVQAITVLKKALNDEAWWVRANAQEALKIISRRTGERKNAY